MILHELYFDGLGGGGTPSGALADAIANDLGSVDRWRTEFSAMGKAIGRRLRMGPLDLLTSRQALAQPMGLRSYDDAPRRARSVHGPFESITIRQRGQTEYE